MQRTFMNATPIDDPMVVLDLLCCRWGEGTAREIVRRFPEDGPYVEIGHHPDFSASRYFRFRITDRVVDQLLASGFVEGKPEWGYTDMKYLHASDEAMQQLWHERSRLGMQEQFRSEWWYVTVTLRSEGRCPRCDGLGFLGNDMEAANGPVCGCGRPSTHESGWCGQDHDPIPCPLCSTSMAVATP